MNKPTFAPSAIAASADLLECIIMHGGCLIFKLWTTERETLAMLSNTTDVAQQVVHERLPLFASRAGDQTSDKF